ncbi:MAG: flagellar assembly protein FliW [Sulfurimonadaceae bacterium]|jgi:flagellar assembly factor FliW
MEFQICSPILGFENVKNVTLEKIDDIFMNMKANEDNRITFTLINPFVLREYDFELTKHAQELLDADQNSNLLVLNIVLIQNPIEDSMVNFIAPMIFNTDTKKAIQIVLPENSNYPIAAKISSFLQQ